MSESLLFEPALWCGLPFAEHRRLLAGALLSDLEGAPGVSGTRIEVGPIGRDYDLNAVVETDVGDLRTPLWSHARASIFCDESIHPANRKQLAPGLAVRAAAERLRPRLSVRYALESRGLTLTLEVEPGVERTWSAERSRFRGRTAVVREDRVLNPGEVDLRDLLAHFYEGPALRLVAEDGSTMHLPASADPAAGPLVSLCVACHHWSEGAASECPHCGQPVEVVVATRPARR